MTWVTGTEYVVRARSTTSYRCHTESSSGRVAITIWSGRKDSTAWASARSGR